MTTPEDDAFVLPSAPPDPNRTLFVSAKFGTTVNRGNYENDRYDFIVSDYYPSGASIADIAADLFAQARATVRAQDAYDLRIRRLFEKLEHSSHTVLEWDARYEMYRDDESIEEADRGRLLTLVTRRRKEQYERDEQARKRREQQELTVHNIIAFTRTWLESNPVPSQEELWSNTDRYDEPLYYVQLRNEWRTHVKGWHDLTSAAQSALLRAPIDAIIAATVADIMDGTLPKMVKPEIVAPSSGADEDFSDDLDEIEDIFPDDEDE